MLKSDERDKLAKSQNARRWDTHTKYPSFNAFTLAKDKIEEAHADAGMGSAWEGAYKDLVTHASSGPHIALPRKEGKAHLSQWLDERIKQHAAMIGNGMKYVHEPHESVAAYAHLKHALHKHWPKG